MSIISLDLEHPHPVNGPACAECGGRTRLTGIEPHPTKLATDLRTYQCIACDEVQAIVVPLAA